jgi:pimeloyl-ACP methyl ester carboxylesterase
VGAEDHASDIVRFIAERDLIDVTLIGVNSSSALLPLVFESIPNRIDGMIFVDGLIPAPGESVADVAEVFLPGSKEKWSAMSASNGGAALPPDDELLSWILADLPESKRVEARAKLLPHPYRALTDPIQYKRFPSAPPYRAYIRCQRTPLANAGRRMAQRAQAQLFTLAASHDAMLSHPEALADRLLEIVAIWNSGDSD